MPVSGGAYRGQPSPAIINTELKHSCSHARLQCKVGATYKPCVWALYIDQVDGIVARYSKASPLLTPLPKHVIRHSECHSE